MQPRFFLMENVPGLLTANLGPGKPPGSLMRAFEDGLGGSYRIDTFVVDAASYGTPQFRERAIVIVNRCDAHVEFLEATHGPTDERRFDSPLDILLPPLEPWATLRDALRDLEDPAPVIIDFSPARKRYLKLIPAGSNWRSLPPDLQRESLGNAWRGEEGPRSGWWRRLSFDAPSPTLLTMPCHASTSLCHPTETRALSLREYARIQQFPDDWVFCGTKAERYAQVGNAVPLGLSRVAGEVIAEALDRVGAAR
jgi:DNA (cytosine-5)-methyltransferase 1